MIIDIDSAIEMFLEENPYPLDDMYGESFEQWDELDEFMENKGYQWLNKQEVWCKE